ncbi:thioesterase family protein [Nevskia ramosa]|uniref:thioesterase family protein n=1 Tax=Nevskia ramosa TaxID=64002 RepID=UPI002354416F|nr:acyl-CoA thioesterase [Nevskia ramosa]
MSLIFRLLWVFLSQTLGRRSRDVFAVQRVHSRALPNDLDLNLHVNNGRLMTFIDFGRIDWLWQIGALQQAYRQRFIPVIGDISVRYLKPLKVFERFTIESRVLGWDAKWGYFEHRLLKDNGDLVLLLVNRGLFWKRGTGAMPIAEVIASCGFVGIVSPALPAWVQTWSRSLDEARAAQKAELAATSEPVIQQQAGDQRIEHQVGAALREDAAVGRLQVDAGVG